MVGLEATTVMTFALAKWLVVVHLIKTNSLRNNMSDLDGLKKVNRMKGEGLIQLLDRFTQEAECCTELKETNKIRVLLPKVHGPIQGIMSILDADCGQEDIFRACYRFCILDQHVSKASAGGKG